MARSKETLIGFVEGEDSSGAAVSLSVYKLGREFRIVGAVKRHLCHPSVRDVSGVEREARLVFGVTDPSFRRV